MKVNYASDLITTTTLHGSTKPFVRQPSISNASGSKSKAFYQEQAKLSFIGSHNAHFLPDHVESTLLGLMQDAFLVQSG